MQYLEKLTPQDLKSLTEFADRRMDWLPRGPFAAEDAVQKALYSIICGTRPSGAGRRPRMENLQTKESFLHYVRSATNSVIEAAKRKRELWVIHETLSAEQDAEDARQRPTIKALPAADEDTAMLDLKTELFVRLRQVAPRRLLPTINDWETTFLWDSILPYRKKRVYRDQVRRLAIRILRQIAEDFRDDTPKHW